MFGGKKKVWVVAVDMGYGHMRAALPFHNIAEGGAVVSANEYPGMPESDKKIWRTSREFYEAVSRFKAFPVLGDFLFALFDKFQEIREFYPSSASIETPTMQLKQIYRLFKKRCWGEHLISSLDKKRLPLLATFFIPAHMAEFWGYKGPIYLIVPDTDISRGWAPLRPQKSKIVYCVPTERAAARLVRYHVKKENIRVTGFPFPEEFTKNGAAKAKKDLRRRLAALDPNGRYLEPYAKIVEQYTGKVFRRVSRRRLVLTFAIGGAGAQAELAEDIMRGAAPLLQENGLELCIVAGVHASIASALKKRARKNVSVHFWPDKKNYFRNFSKLISKTDVLWTKPSELVFYAGLGIPLILAPPIGSQEKMNRRWLLDVGAGVDQKKPELLHQWLPDLLGAGALAEAAMQGFVEIPKDGAENIKRLIRN